MKASYFEDIAFLKDEFPELLLRSAEVASIPASENYVDFFELVSEYISFIETNTYSTCEALNDSEMKAYGLIISGVNADLLTKQQTFSFVFVFMMQLSFKRLLLLSCHNEN